VGAYFQFAALAGGSILLMGLALFVLLRGRIPQIRSRLGLVLSASLLSFAGSLLLPPLLAVSRGGTRLPSWTAVLFGVLVLVLLLSFWRSVLNRFTKTDGEDEQAEQDGLAGLHGVGHGHVPEDDGSVGGLPEAPAEGSRDAEVLETLPEDAPLGFLVEIPSRQASLDGGEALPEAIPVEASREDATGQEAISLVPEPVPPWVPFVRLVDKAWEERSAGRPVQAASWFLACLSRPPSAAVRDAILLDVCALLKEHGYAREALTFLSDSLVQGCEPALLSSLRHELESSLPGEGRPS
jgi:hypothetical protein